MNADAIDKSAFECNPQNNKGIGPVLVLSEVFPPRIGGSGNWLHELYKRQLASRTVLLVGDHAQAPDFDKLSKLNIIRANLSRAEWTIMNFRGVAYFWLVVRHILTLNNKHKFSEIHCGRVIPEGVAGLIASRLLSIDLVCYIHGEDIEIARFSREHRWMAQRVISGAQRLVCNSDSSLDLLEASWRCNMSKVRVLHPGIDTELFCPSSNRHTIRESLEWRGKKVILTISRLDERKGHDRMVKAMPAILKRVPDALYVIVGEGETESLLRKQVSDANLDAHVRFLGAVDRDTLVRCNQACDLFVLPNRKIGGNLEGFGIVLLEAQACGRPVIAGQSGGTVETMNEGESGLIVDCTEAGNLVEPITNLLLDEKRREAMGMAARKLMVEQFSWDRISEQVSQKVFIHSFDP